MDHSCIRSLNKYLLNVHCVPNMLGFGVSPRIGSQWWTNCEQIKDLDLMPRGQTINIYLNIYFFSFLIRLCYEIWDEKNNDEGSLEERCLGKNCWEGHSKKIEWSFKYLRKHSRQGNSQLSVQRARGQLVHSKSRSRSGLARCSGELTGSPFI